MDITEVRFTLGQLKNVPEDEIIFFVQLTHVLNELAVLDRALRFSLNRVQSNSGPLETARCIQGLFFAKTLAGKAYEAHLLLKHSYFKPGLAAVYGKQLPAEAKKALNQITSCFTKGSPLVAIRHKHSFHYDREEARAAYRQFPRDRILTMLLAHQRGNSVYSFSEDILTDSMLRCAHPTETRKGMDSFMSEVIAVCGWFLEFGNHFVEAFLKLRFPVRTVQRKKLNIGAVPPMDKVQMPCFVGRSTAAQ